jgi:hypothetical protein
MLVVVNGPNVYAFRPLGGSAPATATTANAGLPPWLAWAAVLGLAAVTVGRSWLRRRAATDTTGV